MRVHVLPAGVDVGTGARHEHAVAALHDECVQRRAPHRVLPATSADELVPADGVVDEQVLDPEPDLSRLGRRRLQQVVVAGLVAGLVSRIDVIRRPPPRRQVAVLGVLALKELER